MPRLSRLTPVLVALCLAGAAAAPSAGAASSPTFVPHQLIVGFKKNVSAHTQSRLLAHAGAILRKRLGFIRAASVKVRPGRDLGKLAKRLRRLKQVAYVERDAYLYKSDTPNDPDYSQQWALGTTATGAVGAPAAWNSRHSCAKVAVLDTGIQYNHPDLSANVWHNSHEIKNNGIDDDHNGYVDDYYGADLITGKGSGVDEDGHGTHVSGIIAAETNNATGVSGLCWTSTLVAAQFMNSQGKGSTSDAVAGINYAVNVGAKIINCSFGSSQKSSAMEQAIQNAGDKGVLLVVAAGNSTQDIDGSTPSYPASYTYGNELVVASIDSNTSLSSFSNWGAQDVDLGAPGNNILSTYLTSTYHVLSGTSMATPMVSATAAMLRQANSDISVSEIRKAIKDTVTPNPALNGKVLTGGDLNIPAALAAGS